MTRITKPMGWTKQCKRCGQTKDASEFYQKESYADKHDRTCKLCRAAMAMERRLRNNGASQEAAPRRPSMAANYDTGVDRFCACGCGTKLTPKQRTFCCKEHRYPNAEAAETARTARKSKPGATVASAAQAAKAAIVAISTPPPRIIAQLRQIDPSEVRFLSPAVRQFAERAGIIQTGNRR